MLKRVSIQNFKSLKDVTLDLQKVNLLIGPNNSGKTNFLKALEFIANLNEHSNELSINNVFMKDVSKNLFIHLAFENTVGHENVKYSHYVISPVYTGLQRKNPAQKYTLAISRDDNDEIIIGARGLAYEKPETHSYRVQINELKYDIGELNIYKPDPNKIILPATFSADEIRLNGDCSNLIQFLFYLNTNYKRLYQNIENNLKRCIKDIVGFSTPPVKIDSESKLGLKFFGKNDEDYWAEDVSEGVLYFLALLTIINQPNPPKLLLLEEPEKGIHPRRIYEVIQFILGLVDDKNIQVIMTTHSPIVLDMFKDMPESVFIFDKDDEGATSVKNLQHDVIGPDEEESKRLGIEPPHYTDSLGKSWTVGFLGGVPK